MSPINIPIKPPPRVNTANGVNGGGGKRRSSRCSRNCGGEKRAEGEMGDEKKEREREKETETERERDAV